MMKLKLPGWAWVSLAAIALVGVFAAGHLFEESDADVWNDRATGLMWAKDSDSGAAITEWNEAKNYCSNLRLAGHSDWRLPTIDEIAGIYDATQGDEYIHAKGGISLHSGHWAWSSSAGSASGQVWTLHFTDGSRNSYPYLVVQNGFGRALCVRGTPQQRNDTKAAGSAQTSAGSDKKPEETPLEINQHIADFQRSIGYFEKAHRNLQELSEAPQFRTYRRELKSLDSHATEMFNAAQSKYEQSTQRGEPFPRSLIVLGPCDAYFSQVGDVLRTLPDQSESRLSTTTGEFIEHFPGKYEATAQIYNSCSQDDSAIKTYQVELRRLASLLATAKAERKEAADLLNRGDTVRAYIVIHDADLLLDRVISDSFDCAANVKSRPGR